MAEQSGLRSLYIEEMQDLWSANDQMKRVVDEMASAASGDLSERLRRSASGIEEHSQKLKSLIDQAGGEVEKEHCKGMEGLVTEARKHALEAGLDAPLKDVAIIAQYQRMCHYGIAGFGTAKAYAEALGETDAARELDQMLDRIYEADEYMSELAERSKNLEAA